MALSLAQLASPVVVYREGEIQAFIDEDAFLVVLALPSHGLTLADLALAFVVAQAAASAWSSSRLRYRPGADRRRPGTGVQRPSRLLASFSAAEVAAFCWRGVFSPS